MYHQDLFILTDDRTTTTRTTVLLDNAGGHDTKEAIQVYILILEEKVNIKVIMHVPRV